MRKKIVHILIVDKFVPAFIEFVNEHFDMKEHLFVIIGKRNDEFGILDAQNIVFISQHIKAINLMVYMNRAEKIILHGLWSRRLNQVLFINPWLYKKCYWVMWGGDFYFPHKQSLLQSYTIKRIGNFVTYIKGDYELVKKWYGSEGSYHECFMYPSNLYKAYDIKIKEHGTINIQVGNSSDPSNNHLEVFEKLEKYKYEDIKIIVPLSYGDDKYANEIIVKGRKIFGDKFEPLTEFMPFNQYLILLAKIDIAIFNHNRQQGMGNIITLLGLGKKVYMRNTITPWGTFKSIGIKIYDIAMDVSINPLEDEKKVQNMQGIKKYFSEKSLQLQWKNIFGGLGE